MKLLSVNLARAIWICSFFEFNPRGKNLFPAILLLVDLYKFKSFPTPKETLDLSKGIKFDDGEFKNSDGDVVNISFVAYSDGLVVDTRSSTKDSEAFLIEALVRLNEEFNLPRYEQIIRRRTYVSQLYVTTDQSLELLNPRLREISKYLSDDLSHAFEVGGIQFWSDQKEKNAPPSFTIEGVLNVPFSEKRYFSSAPLQTDKHLELLDKFENILLGG